MTVLLGTLLAIGGIWYGLGIFERPAASHEIGSPADGLRAQQRLFELSRANAPQRRDQRKIRVSLSERELNAFLTRHVSEELPLADGGIRLAGHGVVEITGRLPLHAFFGDSVSSVAGTLPGGWAQQPVWLRLRGHLRLEMETARPDLRRLRLEVESLWVGTRRLPTALLTMLPEGAARRATRWPVPETIESVVVEPGRLTLTSRP